MGADRHGKVIAYSIWYNRKKQARLSLESLFSQTYPDIEFVIVDDGSTDDTFEEIKSICKDHADKSITLISQSNRGLTTTLKEQIAKGSSNFLAIHGAGDISAPERIAKQITLATKNQNTAVVGCLVGYSDGIKSLGKIERSPADHIANGTIPKHIPRPGTHGAALIKRAFYEQSGGYRTAFKYAQDADLWLRLSSLGDFRIVRELLYWKYVGQNTVKGSAEKSYMQKLYSELAWQSVQARAAGKDDPVHTYGQEAVLLMASSSRLEKRLLGTAIHSIRNGDTKWAKQFLSYCRSASVFYSLAFKMLKIFCRFAIK